MFAGFIIAVPLLIAGSVYAATMYSTGAMLQPGDVTSSHIRDNTIVNADINSTANIAISKLSDGGDTGTVPFFNGTRMATSTNLRWNASTSSLDIQGGLSVTSTTTIRGVAYTWPSADGSTQQTLSTNGSGALSWATISNPYINNTFTAGETINTGNYVSLGNGATTSESYALDQDGLFTLSSTAWAASAFTSSSTGPVSAQSVYFYLCHTGTFTATTTIEIRNDNANKPGASLLYSYTGSNTFGPAAQTAVSHTLTTPLNMATSTKYWFVIYNPTSTGNLSQCRTATTNSPAQRSSDSGSTWGATTYNFASGWTYSVTVAGRAYQSSASALNFRFNSPVGFATATTTIGNSVTVQNYGFISLLSNLSIGQSYYLSNTLGAISTSAGTNSLKVGQAVTTSIIATKHP